MGDLLRIAIGPTLSLLFFFIGYRRTVGARKERARAAELEVERLMVRRVIVDGYTPGWDDLPRLIARKARQHRVKVSDLASERQFLTAIYTEILENEFVAHSERETLLQRIDGVIRARDLEASTQEDLVVAVDAAIESADRAAIDRQRERALAALAALAAAVGTAVAGLSTVGDTGTRATVLVPVVAVVSVTLVGLAALIVWLRERLENDTRSPTASGAEFEAKVEEAIRRVGLERVTVRDLDSTVDFVIRTEDRTVGIDVKYVRNPTSEYIRMMLRRAQRSVGAFDELVLVIPDIPPAVRQWSGGGMRVLDLRGLHTYLERLRKEPHAQVASREKSADPNA